ncbi:hypothetical protein X777_08049 [Ooceraea biroi]|uniref:Uncharacterized protein n=1 Tax=Ooceraea biroi TaxID=2015173 RepID=A0A026WA91_OOCBI|nr:hypothetical protein X777_08049 [Ooceraea biroi]
MFHFEQQQYPSCFGIGSAAAHSAFCTQVRRDRRGFVVSLHRDAMGEDLRATDGHTHTHTQPVERRREAGRQGGKGIECARQDAPPATDCTLVVFRAQACTCVVRFRTLTLSRYLGGVAWSSSLRGYIPTSPPLPPLPPPPATPTPTPPSARHPSDACGGAPRRRNDDDGDDDDDDDNDDDDDKIPTAIAATTTSVAPDDDDDDEDDNDDDGDFGRFCRRVTSRVTSHPAARTLARRQGGRWECKKEEEEAQEDDDEGDNGDDDDAADGGAQAAEGVDIHAGTRGRRTRPARAHTS